MEYFPWPAEAFEKLNRGVNTGGLPYWVAKLRHPEFAYPQTVAKALVAQPVTKAPRLADELARPRSDKIKGVGGPQRMPADRNQRAGTHLPGDQSFHPSAIPSSASTA